MEISGKADHLGGGTCRELEILASTELKDMAKACHVNLQYATMLNPCDPANIEGLGEAAKALRRAGCEGCPVAEPLGERPGTDGDDSETSVD